MTCQQTHQIEAYLDGELSREARKEFAKHLDHCAACHAVLTEHKRLLQWTDEMIAESLPDLPEHVIDNLDVNAAWSRFQDKLTAPRHKKRICASTGSTCIYPNNPTEEMVFHGKNL